MNGIFSPLLRAISQLDDPAFLRVLLQSLLISGTCFGLLGLGIGWEIVRALPHGWVWVAGPVGAVLAWLAALWLFMPLAVVIASLLMEQIARAVDRRFYPHLPEQNGASLEDQLMDGLALGGRVLLMNMLALLIAVVLPGPGWLLGWAIAAWAIGRGLFVAVAMRRYNRAEAMVLYRQSSTAVIVQGAVLAAMGSVPGLNLLVPVLGTAIMIHILHSRTGW